MAMEMKKFKSNDPLSKLIEYASTIARGKENLYSGRNYCLWGAIAHAVGVPAKDMEGCQGFMDIDGFVGGPFDETEQLILGCAGSGSWDKGRKRQAVVQAIIATGGMTVGQFTKLMKKVELIPAKSGM